MTQNNHTPEQSTQCPICGLWERLPFARKYTTPTTAKDTEGALALGIYLGTKLDYTKACPRHSQMTQDMMILFMDGGRKISPPTPPAEESFVFGIKPLQNENTLTKQPEMPCSIDLSPYLAKPDVVEIATVAPVIPITHSANGEIDFVRLALEAAKAPPTLGKTTLTCPVCGQEIGQGAVHTCSYAPGKYPTG